MENPKIEVRIRYKRRKRKQLSKFRQFQIQKRKFNRLISSGIDQKEARDLTRRKCIYAVVKQDDGTSKAIVLQPPQPKPVRVFKSQPKKKDHLGYVQRMLGIEPMAPVQTMPNTGESLLRPSYMTEQMSARAGTSGLAPQPERSLMQPTGSSVALKRTQPFQQTRYNLRSSKSSKNILMGIMHSKFPDILLTRPDLETIADIMLEEVLTNGSGAAFKPKFERIRFGMGYLEVWCANRATAEWLKRIERKLKPWTNASVVVKEDLNYTKRETIEGLFPYSEKYPEEKVLNLIDIQNKNMYSASWVVVSKQPGEDELMKYKFSVDAECFNLLKEINFVINYKFGVVKLAIVPEDEKTTTIDDAKFHRFTSYGPEQVAGTEELPAVYLQRPSSPYEDQIPRGRFSRNDAGRRSPLQRFSDQYGERDDFGDIGTLRRSPTPEGYWSQSPGPVDDVYDDQMMRSSSYDRDIEAGRRSPTPERYSNQSPRSFEIDYDDPIMRSGSYYTVVDRRRRSPTPERYSNQSARSVDMNYEDLPRNYYRRTSRQRKSLTPPRYSDKIGRGSSSFDRTSNRDRRSLSLEPYASPVDRQFESSPSRHPFVRSPQRRSPDARRRRSRSPRSRRYPEGADHDEYRSRSPVRSRESDRYMSSSFVGRRSPDRSMSGSFDRRRSPDRFMSSSFDRRRSPDRYGGSSRYGRMTDSRSRDNGYRR